jgi:transposase
MHQAVSIGLSNRCDSDSYLHLSIDEKAVLKGHKYISILSDGKTGMVIDIAEGRSDASVDALCNTLLPSQRAEVKSVCSDMWQPYIKGVNSYFPNALH